jgi:hypothetical protein
MLALTSKDVTTPEHSQLIAFLSRLPARESGKTAMVQPAR